MQDVIPLFDLLVILAVLASAGTAARIAYLLIRRRSAQAGKVAKRWGISTVVYISVSLMVSAARPQRSIGVGDRWCFDDWCVSVDRVRRQPSGGDVVYLLSLQAYNAAGRPQRALYPWMFLRDAADPQDASWFTSTPSAREREDGQSTFGVRRSVARTVPRSALHRRQGQAHVGPRS